MIENKKFKMTKENLDLLNLIQHTILITISTYFNMKDKNLSDEKITHNFELICESYLKLCSRRTVNNWIFIIITEYKEVKMMIRMNKSSTLYILLIDLEKSYYDCCSMSQIIDERVFAPVTINFFNVEFVHD